MYPSIVILKKESLLAMIENAVGTHLYRNLYARVGKHKKDILNEGDLACAFFVSSVLTIFSLINAPHATVDGTVRDMEACGWKRISKPKKGCVVVWAPKVDSNGELHKHIGFYIGDGKAVSNDTKKKSPRVHPYANRPIEGLYWHPSLS